MRTWKNEGKLSERVRRGRFTVGGAAYIGMAGQREMARCVSGYVALLTVMLTPEVKKMLLSMKNVHENNGPILFTTEAR
jgi:hypothetical protein